MTETLVEYGVPPKDRQKQQKVQKLFAEAWTRLNEIFSSEPRDKKRVETEIQHLMDRLACLHIELPCQGVEYQGVVVGRDPEIEEDIPPAPFVEWGKALGVSSSLFENKK